jgi:hypothetical protein
VVDLATLSVERTPTPIYPLVVYDAMKRGDPCFPFITLSAPSPIGTKYYAGPGLSSLSLGPIAGRVIKGGWPQNLKLGMELTQASLPAERLTVTFDDSDGSFGAIVEGVNAAQLLQCPVTIGLAIPSLKSPALWPTLRTGILEWAGYSKAKQAQLTIRNNDVWLQGQIPRTLINQNMTTIAASIGKVLPILLGTFDSSGVLGTGQGAIPCIQIDSTHWVICQGASGPVLNVYFGGTLTATGFTIIYSLVGGVMVTMALTTAGQTSVSVDVMGSEDQGFGLGSMLQTPGTMLMWLLQNFALSTFNNGLWQSPNPAYFDLEAFAALDDQIEGSTLRPVGTVGTVVQGYGTYGRQCARYVGTQIKAIDEINTFCSSLGVKPYWNHLGQLSVKMIGNRHNAQEVYIDRDTHYVSVDLEQLGTPGNDSWQQLADPQTVTDYIQTTYSSDATAVKRQSLMEVKDLFAGWNVPSQNNSSWTLYQTAQNIWLQPAVQTNLTITTGTVTFNTPDSPSAVCKPVGVAAALDTLSSITFAAAATYNGEASFNVTPLPPLGAISKVIITYTVVWTSNGGTSPVRTSQPVYRNPAGTLASTTATAGAAAGVLQTLSTTFATNPVSSLAWTKNDVENGSWGAKCNAQVSAGTPDTWQVVAVQIQVFYTGAASSDALIRDIRSRDLNFLRMPVPQTVTDLPIWRTVIAPGDLCALSYSLANGPGGKGWGAGVTSRRLHMLLNHTIDLNEANLRTKATFVEMPRFVPTMFESDLTNIETDYFRPGIAILNQTREPRRDGAVTGTVLGGGALTRFFTRNSVGLPNDPADNRLYQVAAGIESYDKQGLRIQGAATNLCQGSNAFGNAAIWTKTAAAGCAIALTSITGVANDSSFQPPGFDGTAGAHTIASFQMSGTTVPAADNQLAQISIANVGILKISFYNAGIFPRTTTPEPFYWCFQRSSDSKWWLDSNQSWNATKQYNPLTHPTFDGQIHTFTSHYMGNVTSTAGGFIVCQAGTTSGIGSVLGQTNILYQVDMVSGAFGSESIIVPATTAIARAADFLGYTCNGNETVYPVEQVSGWLYFVPDWNTADLQNGNVACLYTALAGAGASGNFDDLRYTASGSGNGTLSFRRSVDGTLYTVSIANPVLVRGTMYVIGIRATGLNGELGLAPFTMDLFFGTKGNVAKAPSSTVAAQQRFTTPYTWWLGSAGPAGSVFAWGFFQGRKFHPHCLTDYEIMRQPA